MGFSFNRLNNYELMVLEAAKNATKENPLTRYELKTLLKTTDSNCRLVIGSLREKGYRIIGGKKGYWYATDKEYAEWIDNYAQYAYTILRRKAAMDAYTEGQQEITWENTTSSEAKCGAIQQSDL